MLGWSALALAFSGAAAAKPSHLIGAWGGPHVGIVSQGALSDVMLDCAAGTIDDALPGQGQFAVEGTYRVATRGYENIDQFFHSEKAKYVGEIGKTSMTLTIVRKDGTTMGPFTLTAGGSPELNKHCE